MRTLFIYLILIIIAKESVCQCGDNVSIIPNSGFELLADGMTEPDNANQFYKALDWSNGTAGSIDYYSTEAYPGGQPPPPNGSEHFVRGRFRTQNSNYIEYIASCLTEDLEPENNYNLLISEGTTPSGPDFEVDVIVLGVNHCDFPLSGSVCIEDDFPEIGRQYISLEYGEWKNISIPIVLNESYSSVIIGLSCTSDFEASDGDFLFDDVCLIKELTTSVNSNAIEESNFQLYPNPSNGVLNLSLIHI